MLPHPLTSFGIQKYYQSESEFKGVCSINNLSKIKDRAYVINIDKSKSIGTHSIALYVNGNSITSFDSFFDSFFEHTPKKIKKFIGNKNIITSIYRIQTYNSIMCGYFRNGFVDFMLKSKSLIDYTNLFFLYEYEKNDKTIIKYLQ